MIFGHIHLLHWLRANAVFAFVNLRKFLYIGRTKKGIFQTVAMNTSNFTLGVCLHLKILAHTQHNIHLSISTLSYPKRRLVSSLSLIALMNERDSRRYEQSKQNPITFHYNTILITPYIVRPYSFSTSTIIVSMQRTNPYLFQSL